MENNNFKNKENPIFSKRIRIGARTYFFDIRKRRFDSKRKDYETYPEQKDKSRDYYLIITESKKIFDEDPTKNIYERHKIFLYKESLDEFNTILQEMIEYLKNNLEEDTLEEK